MNPNRIELVKMVLTSIGVDLSNYSLDISVNLSETVMLTFTHNDKSLSIVVEDPTNYPYKFEIKSGKNGT